MLRSLLATLALAACLALAFAPATAFAQSSHGHSHDSGDDDHDHDHDDDHGHDHGSQHGGDLQELGSHHLELTIEDGLLVAYLTDDHVEPLSAEGYQLVGLILVDGQQHNVAFTHDADNRLVAEGDFSAAELRAVLTLTTPAGESHRARFQTPH